MSAPQPFAPYKGGGSLGLALRRGLLSVMTWFSSFPVVWPAPALVSEAVSRFGWRRWSGWCGGRRGRCWRRPGSGHRRRWPGRRRTRRGPEVVTDGVGREGAGVGVGLDGATDGVGREGVGVVVGRDGVTEGEVPGREGGPKDPLADRTV